MAEYSPLISKILDSIADKIHDIDIDLIKGFAWIAFFIGMILVALFFVYLLLTLQFWKFGIILGIWGIFELANYMGT